MVAAALEFVLEVVSRFVGVSIVAGVSSVAGLRRSYASEWRRHFEANSGVFEWVDLVGLAAIFGIFAAIAMAGIALF